MNIPVELQIESFKNFKVDKVYTINAEIASLFQDVRSFMNKEEFSNQSSTLVFKIKALKVMNKPCDSSHSVFIELEKILSSF